MTSERSPLARSVAVLCLIIVLPMLAAAGDNWRPIGPSDLALKAPIVEKDADAEAIFWEVRLNDDPGGDLIFNHYVRIKVFTDRGRESQSKIDIPFGRFSGREIKINDIAARTIKPDGTIVELKSADVFERTVVRTGSILNHPTLGRLLIFDATDDNTQVGDLPDHEQGSLALIAAGDSGGLVRMPSTDPEANRMEREAEVQLSGDGAIVATVRERSRGQAAVGERRAFRRLSNSDYKQMIERWVTRGAPAAKVMKIAPADDAIGARFGLDVDFSASQYGQVMQNRLLVFNPAIVSRRESLLLTEAKREHPIVLDSYAFTELVRVKLPAGFDVDEMPDAVKLDTPFGSYKTSYEVKNGELVFTRGLTQRAATIPAAQYQVIRSFFERIRAAEQAPVVLAKK